MSSRFPIQRVGTVPSAIANVVLGLPRRAGALVRICAVAWLASITPGSAAINGGRLAPFLQTQAGKLELGSCGVRRSLGLERYVAALYVPRAASLQVLRQAQYPKAVRMHIVDWRHVPKEIPEKWRRALQKQLPQQTIRRLQEAYRNLSPGDVVTIMYAPRQGVTMSVNGTAVAQASGHGVIDSILEAWAEREPLSARLDRLALEHPCR